jgi:hypothetical protein
MMKQSIKILASKERKQFGAELARLQAIQWMISDIYMDLEASRLFSYRAAWMKDQKTRCDVDMAMAKFYATEAAVRCAKKAVDVHGGYGYMMEYPVQRYYRDAEILIASATLSPTPSAVPYTSQLPHMLRSSTEYFFIWEKSLRKLRKASHSRFSLYTPLLHLPKASLEKRMR